MTDFQRKFLLTYHENMVLLMNRLVERDLVTPGELELWWVAYYNFWRVMGFTNCSELHPDMDSTEWQAKFGDPLWKKLR